MLTKYSEISAVILAGGTSQRMGRHKALLDYKTGTFLSHLIDQLNPQVAQLMIGGSPEAQLYNAFKVTTLFDPPPYQGAGPLAGIYAAMRYCQTSFLFSTPCDCPCLPDSILPDLMQSLTEKCADIAIVDDGTRQQPLCALMKTELKVDLGAYLASGETKVFGWVEQCNSVVVNFAQHADYFCNINTLDEYQRFINLAR